MKPAFPIKKLSSRNASKALRLAAGVLALLFIATVAAAGGLDEKNISRSRGMRDATTHESLARALQQTQRDDPMKALSARSGESTIDPAKENQPRDLVANSEILCYRGSATLVPKRAVLHVPTSMNGRMAIQKGAQIVSFPAFFRLNRGWVQTIEVTRTQAEGNDPIGEEQLEAIEKSGRVVVATFQGGPISVLPPKEPAEGDESVDGKAERK